MKQVISTERIPIKLWLDEIEDSALEQAKNLANLPFAYRHIALMPDAHFGYGMPIGGVLAADGVIVPNAVGNDIGCGMCAIPTPWTQTEIGVDRMKKIMGGIRETIPLGPKRHLGKHSSDLMPTETPYLPSGIVEREFNKAPSQIGTLGGGNHFIEAQVDLKGHVWIMIHSGSRNLGMQVAQYYNKRAVKHNEIYHTSVPKNWQLAFFPLGTDEANNYHIEMQYCVDYAFVNRKVMMERIVDIFNNVINHKKIKIEKVINVAHNYARMENHFGKNVMIHRKGATSAKKDETGIIPGSQGTSSYIVVGKGNPDSFMSCSHGAGRLMGRKDAQRRLNFDDEKSILDKQGVIHGMRSEKDLDEAAGAYKDITVVMENQNDLVDIKATLKPWAVIKG